MYILAKGDSMLPTLVDGKIYKVEPLKDGQIYPNDIIVFQKDKMTICHRVKRIINTKGMRSFIETKGDNCPRSDNFVVTYDMVIGKILV